MALYESHQTLPPRVKGLARQTKPRQRLKKPEDKRKTERLAKKLQREELLRRKATSNGHGHGRGLGQGRGRGQDNYPSSDADVKSDKYMQ